MKFLKDNLLDFFETTTVHGLAYLTSRNSKCTRLTWFIIVIAASIFAGYFLTETIAGYNTKFTSTTIETRDGHELQTVIQFLSIISTKNGNLTSNQKLK